MKGNLTQKLNQKKLFSVSPSSWGATGVSFIVEKNTVKIEYDCAEGEIKQKFMVDDRGNFTADGIYTRRYPGALRVKLPPKPQIARYEGTISDNTMKLKITIVETNEILREVVLERDKTPRIHKCY